MDQNSSEEYFRRGEILPGIIQLMVTVTGLRPSALGFTLSQLGFPNHSSMQVGEDEFLVNFSPKSLFREDKYRFLEDARNTEEGGMIEHDGLVFIFKASNNDVQSAAPQAQAAQRAPAAPQAQAAQAQADQRALSHIIALSHLQNLASQHFGEDPAVSHLGRVIDDELASALSAGS